MRGVTDDNALDSCAAYRCEVSQQLGIEILPEERTFPAILHQKLSSVMAKEIFGITDESLLSAIESGSQDRILSYGGTNIV